MTIPNDLMTIPEFFQFVELLAIFLLATATLVLTEPGIVDSTTRTCFGSLGATNSIKIDSRRSILTEPKAS